MPNCNSYVASTDGNDKDDSSTNATPVTKCKHNGIDHGASLLSNQSSSMNKTRHSESPATTQFVRGHENLRPWDSIPNLPVWVRIWDGYGGRGWVEGIVHRVEDLGITTAVKR